MDDADLSDVFGIDMEAPPAEAAEAKPKPAPKAKKATPKKPAKKAKKKEAAPAKPAKAAKAKKTAGKTTGKAAAARKTEKTARKKPEKTSRKTATKPAPRKPRSSDKTAVPKGKATAIDTVAAVIAKHPKGVGVADIRKATGFDDRKIYNIVHQLKEKGRIRSAGWGKYASA